MRNGLKSAGRSFTMRMLKEDGSMLPQASKVPQILLEINEYPPLIFLSCLPNCKSCELTITVCWVGAISA